MRVLAVGTMYPPHSLGGYEAVWASAVRRLRGRGDDVRVLCTDFHRDGAEPGDERGVFRELRWYWRDHEFPPTGVRERFALERHNVATLRRHLDDFRPEVVTWWAVGGGSLGLLEVVRRRGIPAVAFVHDDWLGYAGTVDAWSRMWSGRARALPARAASRLTGIPTRVDLPRAARYVFVSETTRRRARQAGHVLPDTAVAHSGIAPVFADAAAPEKPAWTGRLASVGRIDPRKGLATAVRALSHLPEDTRLTVHGTGDARAEAELRALATSLGVAERVVWAGPSAPEELVAAYAAADAVVFPVEWEEPWGLVGLEAMAVGRPVIATGRGGSGEYLRDGDNCLLHPAGDAGALAGAVTRLAGDPGLRARLRDGGLATARRHPAAAFDERVAAEVDRAARGTMSS